MMKKRRIDVFNSIIYFGATIALSALLIDFGLLDLVGKPTVISIGELSILFRIKLLIFFLIYYLNAVIHEVIHYLTGKLVIPNAKFEITFRWNRAQTRRIGGEPTRAQDQIFTIMPFIVLSVVTFFVGFGLKDITDIPMYFVLFNTVGSVKDIEFYLYAFCFPKDTKVSEMNIDLVANKNRYCRFWKKWDCFFSK